jgi:hypothetical protein
LEARRLAPNKPIYPFIWNRYHKSNDPIEVEFLEAQFESLFQTKDASGVVVWLLYKEGWDDSSNWVVALKRFLDRRAQASANTP